MIKVNIRLDLISDIEKLSQSSIKYDFDIDAKCGKYTVNAKSIIGVMSIATNNKIELNINAPLDKAEQFLNDIRDITVDNPTQV